MNTPNNSGNDVQLGVGMDATGVDRSASAIEQRVEGMAARVAQTGERASKGVEAIGAGGEKAAEKLDRGTRSIISSIERTTAALKAGGRGTADFFEEVARLRGLNVDQLKPYLDQLREVERAQRAASGSLDNMGMSARATAAAMRSVPAQFTDIITSLQGGQAPLTVLLQQGGQLKDMFGGIGNAARALGGYIAGLVNPYTVAAAAAGALTWAFYAGAKEAQAFERQIILSGQAAGVTTLQLTAMAAAVRATGAATQGRASEVLGELAGSGAVAADNLERFVLAAVRLESVGGPAADETAKAFASLAKDPLNAALKLNEGTNFLTRSLYEQIKALDGQGRAADAARVAQEAYAAAIEDRTPALLQNLGLVERAWAGIKRASAQALDAVLDIGRGSELEAAIQRSEADVRMLRAAANNGVGRPGDALRAMLGGPSIQEQLAEAERVLATLRESARLQASAASMAADQARQVKLLADYRKDELQYLPKVEQYQRAVLKVVTEGVAAGEAAEAIQRRVAALQQKFAEQSRGGAGAARELEAQADLLAKLAGLTTTYNNDISRLNAQRAAGKLTEEQYGDAVRALVALQPFAVRAAKEQADALQAQAKAAEEAARAYEQYLAGLSRTQDAEASSTQRMRDELISMTAGKAVLEEIVLVREQNNLALAEERVLSAASQAEYVRLAAIAQQLREQLDLRRAIATTRTAQTAEAEAQRTQKELSAASAKAARDAEREWQRAAQQIEQSITDALMRGFEAGKGFGRTLRDTLENMFRALVLRPVVSAIVQPVAYALQGALGMPGTPAGNALAVANNGAGLLNMGRSLAGFGNAAASAYTYGNVASGAAYGTGFGTQQSLMLAQQEAGLGTAASGAAQAVGAAASMAAAAVVGHYAGRSISGGYSTGGSGNSLVNAGTAIGALVGGPLGAAIGGAIGGGINRLFGRRDPVVTGTGVVGTVSAEGFTGQAFTDWLAKGGTFRSDRTGRDLTAVSEAIDADLDAQVSAVYSMVQRYTDALGLPVEAAQRFTGDLKIAWGATEEENRKAITDALANLARGLAGQYETQLEQFRRTGEELADTLQRLGELELFSDRLAALGGAFAALAAQSVDAREQVIGIAGGMEAFSNLTRSFVDQFYTRDEISRLRAREVQDALEAVGIDGRGLTSRAQFRALVDSLDTSTEEGRRQMVALLSVADAFAQITTSAEELTNAGKGVVDYIAQLRGAATGEGGVLAARAVYQADLASAQAGDVQATGRIVSSARSLVEAVRATATDPIALARETSRIATELQSLPAAISWLQQMQASPAPQGIPAVPSAEVRTIMPVEVRATAASAPMSSEQITELADLLTPSLEAIALNTQKTQKALDRMTEGGATSGGIGWVA